MFQSYTRSDQSTHKLARTGSGRNSAEYDRASRDSHWGEIGIEHILAELTSCAAQLAATLQPLLCPSCDSLQHGDLLPRGVHAEQEQQQQFGNLSLREKQHSSRLQSASSPTQGVTSQHSSTISALHGSANATNTSRTSWHATASPPSLPPSLTALAPDIWAVNLVCAWLHGCMQSCSENQIQNQTHTAVLFGSIPSVQSHHMEVSSQQDTTGGGLGSPWRQTQSWPNPLPPRPPHTPHGAPKRSEPEHQQRVLGRVQGFLQQAVANVVTATILPGIAAQVRAVQAGAPAWSQLATRVTAKQSRSSSLQEQLAGGTAGPTISDAVAVQSSLGSVESDASGAPQRGDGERESGLNGTSWSDTWFGKQQQQPPGQQRLRQVHDASPATEAAAARELVRFDNFDEGLGGAEMLLEEEGLEWEGGSLSADSREGGSEAEVDVDWEPPVEEDLSEGPHESLTVGSVGSSSVGTGGAGRSCPLQPNSTGKHLVDTARSGASEQARVGMSGSLSPMPMGLSVEERNKAKTLSAGPLTFSCTTTASLTAGMVETGTRALCAAAKRVAGRVVEGLRQQQAWRLHHLAAFEWTHEHILLQVGCILRACTAVQCRSGSVKVQSPPVWTTDAGERCWLLVSRIWNRTCADVGS